MELHDVAEICRPALMMNGVHKGGNFELNLCLHRQPVKTLQCRLNGHPVIQFENEPSGHVLYIL